MTAIRFGSWRPDTAGVNAQDQAGGTILNLAKNVYRVAGGYGPIAALALLQTGTGLPANCVGMFAARATAGGWIIFAGTQTKLYKYNSGTSNWDDFTRASGGNYSVPAGDIWQFSQFGSKVLATNINDNLQIADVDSGGAFADGAGSPPKARYVCVVNDFVILGCLNGSPRSIINSAFNSTTGWTIGTNLCDQQDLPDGHRICGLTGGEFGWIVQERAIRRLIFQPGSDQAFRIERVEKDRGAVGTYGVVGVESDFYFPSQDGFYKMGPNGLMPIGHQKINNWFQTNFDQKRIQSIVGFSDWTGPRIMWAGFQSSTSNYYDRVLIYDWLLDDFTYMDQTAAFFGLQATAGASLDGLDIYGSIDFADVPSSGTGPGLPYSLDSPVWQGGTPLVAAVGTDGKLYFLNGGTMQTATLTTAPLQFSEGGLSIVTDVEPVGVWNGATNAIRVSRRATTMASLNYTPSITPSTRTNVARTKASGRIHDIELTVSHSAGTAWVEAQGLEVMATPDGKQ